MRDWNGHQCAREAARHRVVDPWKRERFMVVKGTRVAAHDDVVTATDGGIVRAAESTAML